MGGGLGTRLILHIMYRMAGKFGGEFGGLADYERTAKLNSANINFCRDMLWAGPRSDT